MSPVGCVPKRERESEKERERRVGTRESPVLAMNQTERVQQCGRQAVRCRPWFVARSPVKPVGIASKVPSFLKRSKPMGSHFTGSTGF